jgi:hypothetical protein
MTSIFDGLGTLTAAVFGAPVSVTPPGGSMRIVQAVFREEPTAVLMQDGTEITTVLPTLRAPRAAIADLAPDSEVIPGNGKIYRVVASIQTANPATDGHMVLQLEAIDAS